MIDLHSHVLPAIDDGPGSTEEAVGICRISVGEGVRVIVATPHMFCGVGTDDLEKIRQAYLDLCSALQSASVDCDLRVAGEVRLVEDLMDRIRRRQVPFYDAGRRYLLIETPFAGGFEDLLKHTIFQLRLNAMIPVIAHPERIRVFVENPALVEQVVRQGALLQVNATGLLPDIRDAVTVLEWIRRGWVHVVAGDMHGFHRLAGMAAAREQVQRCFDGATAELLFEENPRRILSGEILPEA